jgi:HEAT repeat protein
LKFLLLTALCAPFALAPRTALAQTPTAEIVAAVAHLATNDVVTADRADALLFDAGPAAVPPLVEALSHRTHHVTRRAASLLGRIGDARAIGPLISALGGEKDEDVRLAIAIALCRLDEKAGVPPLIDLLDSNDREVRLAASTALGRFTHHDFAFEFDAPRAARLAALGRWRAWWKASMREFEIVR